MTPENDNPEPQLIAWSGRCDSCGAVVIYAADAETEPDTVKIMQDWPETWERFSDCQVCDGSIEWNGSDPLARVLPRYA